ncbi:MAG: RidA family protein [Coriobacteriia bacterium]|nr:RidA family protein [Coriobacteriia bacterium]
MKQTIYTDAAPEPVGPYSQAIKVGDLVYLSGQVPLDPKTGLLVEGGIEEQTARVCENVKAVLEAEGLYFDDVIKTTCYLIDMDEFAAFNAVYATYFPEESARACVAVAALPKGARVEVETIASIPARQG